MFDNMSCRFYRYIYSQRTHCKKLHFHLTVTVFFILPILSSVFQTYSLLYDIRQRGLLSKHIAHHNKRRLLISKRFEDNVKFCRLVFHFIFYNLLFLALVILLLILRAGDVHPNPGPQSNESSCSVSTTSDIYNFLNHPNHVSTVHYNVQSISNKLDTLIAEFSFFDILSFSETWLHDEFSSDELIFPSFYPPERKDRTDDRYGGVILYVKNTLSYIRRHDLEPNRLECIWI